MAAINSWLVTNVVARKEPFQLTKESRRNSLPLTVNKNWLPPAVALLGEIEVIVGVGGHVPQDRTVTSVNASTDVRANLGALAIGLHLRQLADRIERCSGRSGCSVHRGFAEPQNSSTSCRDYTPDRPKRDRIELTNPRIWYRRDVRRVPLLSGLLRRPAPENMALTTSAPC